MFSAQQHPLQSFDTDQNKSLPLVDVSLFVVKEVHLGEMPPILEKEISYYDHLLEFSD